MRLIPQAFSDLQRIDVAIHGLPPPGFVAGPMQLTVMGAAKRHREFIADFAAQGLRLREPQVMRIGRLAIAEQAGLRGDKVQMRLVAAARRMPDCQGAAVGIDLFFRAAGQL